MSPLSETSVQALDLLRNYSSPTPSIYHSLPLTRRAAVLILLFADRAGDLRVVLTLRSALLRTFAGQVALPGGKADYLSETPFQTARREAWEEIGLPMDDEKIPAPFMVEHLTELPCSLSVTSIGVRPCVAFLQDNSVGQKIDVVDALTPRLQEQEVSSIFTVPLERFLCQYYMLETSGGSEKQEVWYTGNWVKWNERLWRMHEFQAPVWERATLRTYRVWGMTARIMVDAARLAYGRNPEYEFDDKIGDEDMITDLWEAGKMKEKLKPDGEREPVQIREVVKRGNL